MENLEHATPAMQLTAPPPLEAAGQLLMASHPTQLMATATALAWNGSRLVAAAAGEGWVIAWMRPAPVLNLTSPHNATTWRVGEVGRIHWESAYADSHVMVVLWTEAPTPLKPCKRNGTNVSCPGVVSYNLSAYPNSTILSAPLLDPYGNATVGRHAVDTFRPIVLAAAAPNNGTFDWRVPPTLAPGNHFKVCVVQPRLELEDCSVVFAVQPSPGAMRVVAPLPTAANGTVVLEVKATVVLKWEAPGGVSQARAWLLGETLLPAPLLLSDAGFFELNGAADDADWRCDAPLNATNASTAMNASYPTAEALLPVCRSACEDNFACEAFMLRLEIINATDTTDAASGWACKLRTCTDVGSEVTVLPHWQPCDTRPCVRAFVRHPYQLLALRFNGTMPTTSSGLTYAFLIEALEANATNADDELATAATAAEGGVLVPSIQQPQRFSRSALAPNLVASNELRLADSSRQHCARANLSSQLFLGGKGGACQAAICSLQVASACDDVAGTAAGPRTLLIIGSLMSRVRVLLQTGCTARRATPITIPASASLSRRGKIA